MNSSGFGLLVWARSMVADGWRLVAWLSVLGSLRLGVPAAGAAPADADPGFRAEVTDPVAIREFAGLCVDAEGRVTVAVLDFSPALPGPGLVRFLPEGRVDTTYQPRLVGSRVTAILGLRSGGTMVGGTFRVTGGGVTRTNLARLNPDGSLDPSFDAGGGWGSTVQIRELSEGELLVLGRRQGEDGVPRPGPHRLLADGRLDEGFAPWKAWAELGVEAVVPREDGATYLIGMIRPRATNDLARIARALPDGTVDDAFRYIGDWVHSAWVTSSEGGVYVVTSSPESTLATTVLEVLRLRPDGTPDPEFHAKVTGRNYVIGADVYNPPLLFAMARQVDGRLLMVGKFDRVNGVVRRNVARLEADGSVDGTFDPGTGPALSTDTTSFGYAVRGLALASDGGIYLGGQFDRYAGRVYRLAVRLQGDPVPRLRVRHSGGSVEAEWIGHPGERVEIESSSDFERWSAYYSFTHDGGVAALPRPTGDTVFLRGRWQ